MWDNFPFDDNEVMINRTSLQFIDCYWEILGSLCKGIPLVILPTTKTFDYDNLLELILKYHITRITLIPQLLQV